MSTHGKWTNSSLRKELGEHGFLQEGETVYIGDRNEYHSSFVRGKDELILVEVGAELAPPRLFQKGVEVVAGDLGWRNSQIQHDKLKGD